MTFCHSCLCLYFPPYNTKSFFFFTFSLSTPFHTKTVHSNQLKKNTKSDRVLSLRSGVIHGFCDRALTLPTYPVFMWVRGFVCALLSACLVSCWSVVFASQHSCLELWFRVGVRTFVLHVLSHLGACGLEFAQPNALLSTCVVFCVVARSSCFIGCMHSCYMLCCVPCVFHRLHAFMLSNLCEHAAYEYSH